MEKGKILSVIVCAAMCVSTLYGCSFSDIPSAPSDESEEQSNSVPSENEAVTDKTDVRIETSSSDSISESSSDLKNENTKVTDIMNRMSLRDKVGQLFIVQPDALNIRLSQDSDDNQESYEVTSLTDSMISALHEYPAGGIIMFGRNLVSPEQITEFNRALQQNSPIPMFICVDEEGGSVSRLANNPDFNLPKYINAADVGKDGNPEDAVKMGNTIGSYMHRYGFNTDFAPDADVNTNPDNPVIGKRAFSSDAETAACLARGMADGLKQNGIMPVFKHFPGHGDTKEDSHMKIAITDKSEYEMENCEWIPFEMALSDEGIMVGHIAAPEITGDMTPATMSEKIVSGILKDRLDFKGLIITDSLSMGAITDNYTPSEAAVTALSAGCDILLMPSDYRQAFDGVMDAVINGTITEQELDKKVMHILKCKEANGIL